VSRIHDALRLGRAPAPPSAGGRTAHADAVLAALGYRPGRPRRPNAGVVLGIVVFATAAVAVWYMLPATVAPRPPAAPKQMAAKAALPKPGATQAAPVAMPEVRPRPPIHPAPPEVSEAQTPSAPKPAPVTIPVKGSPIVARRPDTSARPVAPKPPVTAAQEPAVKTDEFALALYYQRTGDFEQALVHYKAVLQRDEMNADAHNNVGNLYMSKALYEDATREFRRVVAIEPKYVTGHVNLSAALYQLKRYDEAAAEARAAIRLDARNGDAYVNLALAQAASGQTSDALSSLTRALEIDRHSAAAHYNLALQFEKAGEVALALDHYRAFLQYAGPEQAGYAADVRSRMQALEHK
jgi:Tfp pilus assembly protein PilF